MVSESSGSAPQELVDMDRQKHVRPSIYDQGEVSERSTKSESLGELAERGSAGDPARKRDMLEWTRIGEWQEALEGRGFHCRHDGGQEGETDQRRRVLLLGAAEVINLSVDPCDNVVRSRNPAHLDRGPRNTAHPNEEENQEDYFQLTAVHSHSICCVNDESRNLNVGRKIA